MKNRFARVFFAPDAGAGAGGSGGAGYDIEIDGSFGPLSDQALRAYQAQYGLEIDGKCGPATRACMQTD